MLTSLPLGSIVPDHTSIPEVPAISANQATITTPGIESTEEIARSRMLVAKGDAEHLWWLPEIGFGTQYNRNTTLLNNVQDYFNPLHPLPANNLSSGFSIRVPLFDRGLRDKAKESAAEALRAKVEAEHAQQQNDLQITMIASSLRELDTEAEIASLKQQIADEQLKAVITQLEFARIPGPFFLAFCGDGTSQGPHTTLGTRTGSDGKPYTQGATFDKDGKFVGRTDVTDHGRPQNHDNPQFHPATSSNGVGPAQPIPNN